MANKIIKQKTDQNTTAKFTSDAEVTPRNTEQKSKVKSNSEAEVAPINAEGRSHRDLPHNENGLKGESLISSPSKNPSESLSLNKSPNLSHKFTSQTKRLKLGEHKRCQYVDPKTRRSCDSHWFLQIDHIQSRWAGAHGGVDNAQVLCAAHNKLKYQKESNLKLRKMTFTNQDG